MYYEVVKPSQAVTANAYRPQLNKLSEELLQKRPAITVDRRKLILLHDDARAHVARVRNQTPLQFEWEAHKFFSIIALFKLKNDQMQAPNIVISKINFKHCENYIQRPNKY